MRVLIVGAGAIGGYFGGRLMEKGCDVTFLVREKRKAQLEKNGLCISSIHGNFHGKNVQMIMNGDKVNPYDLIILAVKSYHLSEALSSVSPYVGQGTTILPLLNGVNHLEILKTTFGEEKIIGGLCFIESTLNEQGEVDQFSGRHDLVFGELNGSESERVRKMAQHMAADNINIRSSTEILKDMWMKYIFISSFSGITSMMRSSIGPILSSPFGRDTYRRLVVEITSVAWKQERSLDENVPQRIIDMTEQLEPGMKSSMLRDIEKGMSIEADHLHGILLDMAGKDASLPVLRAVYSALKTYQSSLV